MALKQTVMFKGVELKDAYLKIESFTGSKDSLQISLYVKASASGEAIDGHLIQNVPYNIDGENPIKQAYIYLKTLPQYADAVDC